MTGIMGILGMYEIIVVKFITDPDWWRLIGKTLYCSQEIFDRIKDGSINNE